MSPVSIRVTCEGLRDPRVHTPSLSLLPSNFGQDDIAVESVCGENIVVKRETANGVSSAEISGSVKAPSRV